MPRVLTYGRDRVNLRRKPDASRALTTAIRLLGAFFIAVSPLSAYDNDGLKPLYCGESVKYQRLFDAVYRKDLAAVEDALKKGLNPNAVQCHTGAFSLASKEGAVKGNSLLSQAAYLTQHEIADALMRAGASPDLHTEVSVGEAGHHPTLTPLMMAVVKNDLELVRRMVRYSKNINARSDNLLTALHVALAIGGEIDTQARPVHEEIAIFLVEKGAKCDLEAQSNQIFTLLDHAVEVHATETARAMLKKGCRPSGVTLALAAQHGQVELIQAIVKRGVNPNTIGANNHVGLHYAVRGNQPEAVKTLLKLGAKPGLLDATATSPLWWALMNNNVEIARLLVDSGASLERATRTEAALPIALSKNFQQFALYCLSSGAKINTCEDDGSCAMPQIARNPAFVKAALEYVKNLKVQDKNGMTLLMHAVVEGNSESVKLLLQAGADPDLKDKEGDSARSLARDRGNTAILQLFNP